MNTSIRTLAPTAGLAAATFVGLTLSAAATPITGPHNGQAGSGYAPAAGNYTVEKDTQFNGNGISTEGAGLELVNSSVLLRGGQFIGNNTTGLYAKRTSIVANNGGFLSNLYGVILEDRSQLVVNGGFFNNELINLGLINRSSVVINRGTFIGAQSPDSVGLDIETGSSSIINGGEFSKHWNAVGFYKARDSFITGGSFFDNFNCVNATSTNLWITGGQFLNNGGFGALISGNTNDPRGNLMVDRGVFYANNYGGVGVDAGSNVSAVATINGGTFLRNGSESAELVVAGYSTSAGVRVSNGGTATINGGQFHLNEPAAVQALGTHSIVTINEGDFRSNGRDIPAGIEAPAPKLAVGDGFGVYVHSEAKAVINGGDFSNNSVSLNIGLPYQPEGYSYAPRGQAIVNGGVFHASQNSVRADSGSVCNLQAGDFQAPIAVTSLGGSKVRVFGGTYRSTEYDFDVYPGSVIELTGVFEGYDNSKGDIVLSSKTPPLLGKLRGQLQKSTTPDTFIFRVRAGGKLILHPTNASTTQTPAASGSAATS